MNEYKVDIRTKISELKNDISKLNIDMKKSRGNETEKNQYEHAIQTKLAQIDQYKSDLSRRKNDIQQVIHDINIERHNSMLQRKTWTEMRRRMQSVFQECERARREKCKQMNRLDQLRREINVRISVNEFNLNELDMIETDTIKAHGPGSVDLNRVLKLPEEIVRYIHEFLDYGTRIRLLETKYKPLACFSRFRRYTGRNLLKHLSTRPEYYQMLTNEESRDIIYSPYHVTANSMDVKWRTLALIQRAKIQHPAFALKIIKLLIVMFGNKQIYLQIVAL